jgi:hypothetical protein
MNNELRVAKVALGRKFDVELGTTLNIISRFRGLDGTDCAQDEGNVTDVMPYISRRIPGTTQPPKAMMRVMANCITIGVHECDDSAQLLGAAPTYFFFMDKLGPSMVSLITQYLYAPRIDTMRPTPMCIGISIYSIIGDIKSSWRSSKRMFDIDDAIGTISEYIDVSDEITELGNKSWHHGSMERLLDFKSAVDCRTILIDITPQGTQFFKKHVRPDYI